MVVLRSGFDTTTRKKREVVRRHFKRIAKGAQRQAVQKNLQRLREQQENQRCVVCLFFHEPAELALHRKWLRQMKDYPEKQFLIKYPFESGCCKQFMHLACYISHQRLYHGAKKDWKCPHCRIPAIYNVRNGNFFLGYNQAYDSCCADEICWIYLNRDAPCALHL